MEAIQDSSEKEVYEFEGFEIKQKYLTEDIQNHEPSEQDLFLTISTGDYQRLIWGEPLELKEREKTAWANFEEYVKQNNLPPPPARCLDSERLGYRILQTQYWNSEKAYAVMKDSCEWYQKNFPKDPNKFLQFLQSGAVYSCGRAKKGKQPIIIINVRKFIDQDKSLDEMIEIAAYFFDWIVRNMMVPGRIESFLVILDLKDVGITQMPIQKLKGFVSTLQSRFRGRMFRMIVCFSQFMLRALWSVVWTWVDEYIKTKIKICGYSNYSEALLEYISEDVLEEKYGGKRPAITGNFFPPQI